MKYCIYLVLFLAISFFVLLQTCHSGQNFVDGSEIDGQIITIDSERNIYCSSILKDCIIVVNSTKESTVFTMNMFRRCKFNISLSSIMEISESCVFYQCVFNYSEK